MDAGLFQQIYNALVPVALHGPLLTDQSGLPRYWSAIWSVVSSGQLAASTHTKKLRYIEDLYSHADRLLGQHALDDALGSLNERTLAEILESCWRRELIYSEESARVFCGWGHPHVNGHRNSNPFSIGRSSMWSDTKQSSRQRVTLPSDIQASSRVRRARTII